MSTAKNHKKLEKRKKNSNSCRNQVFAIFFAKKSTISSSKRLNIWGSGHNSIKASERQFMRQKEIIVTTYEDRKVWKRQKGKKSIQLRTYHNKARQLEALVFLESTKLYKIITALNIKHKQIRKGFYALETLLKKKFHGCSAWKKELALFVYYFPIRCYRDPIDAMVDTWYEQGMCKKKLKKDILDVMKRLRIVLRLEKHCILKVTSGFLAKKKEDILTLPFFDQKAKHINKDIAILHNHITNFIRINYKKQKTAYFKYHIWKIVRSYDAQWKEKRYKKNILLYYGRDLLINPDYFQFATKYKEALKDIDMHSLSYFGIKKRIETFKFLAEKYVGWFLDNKKEARARHTMIYRLTQNPTVFNRK